MLLYEHSIFSGRRILCHVFYLDVYNPCLDVLSFTNDKTLKRFRVNYLDLINQLKCLTFISEFPQVQLTRWQKQIKNYLQKIIAFLIE